MINARLIFLRAMIWVKQLPLKTQDQKLSFKALSTLSLLTLVFWCLLPIAFIGGSFFPMFKEFMNIDNQENDSAAQDDQGAHDQLAQEVTGLPHKAEAVFKADVGVLLFIVYITVLLFSILCLPYILANALDGLTINEIEEIFEKKSSQRFTGKSIVWLLIVLTYWSLYVLNVIANDPGSKSLLEELLVVSVYAVLTTLYFVILMEVLLVIDLRVWPAGDLCGQPNVNSLELNATRNFFNETWPCIRKKLELAFGFIYFTSSPALLIFSYGLITEFFKSPLNPVEIVSNVLSTLLFFLTLLLVSLFAEAVHSDIKKLMLRTREHMALIPSELREPFQDLLDALSGAEQISVYGMFTAGMDTFASLLTFILTYLIVLLQSSVN